MGNWELLWGSTARVRSLRMMTSPWTTFTNIWAQRTAQRCSTNQRSSSSRPAEEVMLVSADIDPARCFWLQKQTACISEGKGAVILADNHYPAKNPATGDDANIEGDTLRVVHEEKDFISLLCCTPGVVKDTNTCWSNSWLRRLDIFCYCLCLPPDAVGYRDTIRGSFLIQVVVDVFNGSAARDHLEELFRKVRFTGQSECRHCDERTLIFSFFCNAGHASLWRPSPGQQKADADQGQVHPHEALLLLPRPQPRLTP